MQIEESCLTFNGATISFDNVIYSIFQQKHEAILNFETEFLIVLTSP